MKHIFTNLKDIFINYRKSISAILLFIMIILVFSGYNLLFSENTLQDQWNTRHMNYKKLHKISTGDSQTIALIDTGISKFQSVEENINLTEEENIYDTNGHGTMMYSLIKGYSDKVTGIAPNSKIISIKVMNSDENISPDKLEKAIDIAIERNVDIISLSLGSTKENKSISEKIDQAIDSGITVISSAGDYEQNFLLFPSSMNKVISVGSIAANGRVSEFTNAPDKTTINAPGEEIFVVDEKEKVFIVNGTSEATAIITGYVALLKDKALKEEEKLSPIEIQKLLEKIKESDITYVECLKSI